MRKISSIVVIAVSLCALVVVAGSLAQTDRHNDTEIAYAHVNWDGTLDMANSKNVVAIGGGDGLYCFKLTFTPKNAVATIASDPTGGRQGLGFIETTVPPTPMFTCSEVPNPDANVATFEETGVGGSGQSAGGWAFYAYFRK